MRYLQYFLIIFICITSYTAYDYLQTEQEQFQIEQNTDMEASSFRSIHSMENSADMTTTENADTSSDKGQETNRPAEEHHIPDQGMLPDVEFLKFLYEKSKEGIPVLRLSDYL